MVERLGGDGRQVVLGPRYLQRRSQSGDPAIQHAYALTTYATEAKTFDSTFAYLDAGLSREDFLVAVSRNSGHVTAYGVAASVFLDADLGPATRDLTDSAHDLRAGAERVASEFAATEVSARKLISARSPFELAARRTELRERLGDGPLTPASEKLAAVDKRIGEDAARLTELAVALEGILGGATVDRRRLALIESTERLTQKQLRRLEADRDGIAREAAADAARPTRLTSAERAELTFIEDHLLDVRRRLIAAERLSPSKLTVESLGPRPSDPARAQRWNEGVDLIFTYRQHNRVTSAGGDPLGPKCSRSEIPSRLKES
jgi:hypothetical protein